MIPMGYMAKRISKKPDWLKAPQVIDVYSVGGCVSEDFVDYILFWMHNGYWLFDSPEIIRQIANENSIALEGTSLFYYEAHELEFDGQGWHAYAPAPQVRTDVILPSQNNFTVLMWLPFTPKRRRNVPRSPAIAWRKACRRMS